MKYNNKSFLERYEAWKNGADYWKDIRGVNLGAKAQEDELSEEERQLLKVKANSILNAYSTGKDSAFTYDIAKGMNNPIPFDAPLNQELPRFKDGKSRAITAELFYNEMVAGGVDPMLAAGIAGNVQQESSFNPDSISPGGKYRGYAQLSPDLVNYVRAAYGGYDHAHQMQFLIDMAKGSPRAVKGNATYNDMLNRAKAFVGGTYVTPQSAAFGWEKSFERSGGQLAAKRMRYANDIYTKYYKPSKTTPIKTAAETLNDPAQIPVVMPEIRESTAGQYIPVESANVIANESERQIYDRMMNLVRKQILEPVPMPNAIQKMLQGNNRGKDGYGQKLWQRRGANLHFKGGKDKLSYQDWANKAEKYKGININGDNTYDYRAFYNENSNRAYALLNGDPGAHFVDKFKTPYHPTFSDESVYSNASHPGGHWGRYDYRDAYYAPMFSYTNPGDRIGYLNMAEDNGVIPFMNNGSMYRVDGDLYGGVLPAVTVTPKLKFDTGTDNNAGGDLAKLLGGGEGLLEVGNFAAQMIPGYGSYLDWKQAINDPSLENIGTAALTTAGDLFTVGMGGAAIRASIKAAKAVKELRKAREAYKATKALAPGTKLVVRAIEAAGKAADKARAAQLREKAIKAVKNSVKAEVATHLTDMKDGYQRVKRYIQKHYL